MLKKSLLLVAFLTLGALSSQAQTLAEWTFETVPPTTAGPLAADIGTGTAFSNGTGTFSNPSGNGTPESWSMNNWSVGNYYEFTATTTTTNILYFTWDQTSSNTGPANFALTYSIDGGTSFNSIATVSLTNDSWSASTYKPISTYAFSVDLTNYAGAITFRLTDSDTVAVNGSTVASTGTNRIDNVFISLDPVAVPEPGTVALVGLGLGVVLFGVRRRRAS